MGAQRPAWGWPEPLELSLANARRARSARTVETLPLWHVQGLGGDVDYVLADVLGAEDELQATYVIDRRPPPEELLMPIYGRPRMTEYAGMPVVSLDSARVAVYRLQNWVARFALSAERLPGWKHDDSHRVRILLMTYRRDLRATRPL